ncbi:MAG: hypothetical protein ABI402_13950 [Ferruginibacter sp.]
MRFICLIVFAAFFTTSCKKTDDGLIRTDDQGTFDVEINGSYLSPCIFKANSVGPISTNFALYNATDFLLTLNEKDECNDSGAEPIRSISLFFDSIQIVANTTYKLGNEGKGQVWCAYYTTGIYKSDLSLPGNITITKFDPAAKIIAGTFYGTLSKTPGVTVALTNGKFDLKY